jgi:hypothetical protein
MIGGISTAGILGAKAVVKYKGVKKERNINVDSKTCWSLFSVPKQVLLFYLLFIHQIWVKSILL